jgi:hypothetical protein
MNTRAKLTIVVSGLLLAFASAPHSAKAVNLLVDPDFNGVPPLSSAGTVLGPPFVLGQWGPENGAIVGVDGGVTPLTASTMLAEYSPGTSSYTQTFQATDVSADPAGSTYTLSAFFDANQNLSAASAFVNMSFYDASYNPLGGPPSSGLILDNNTATWQQISVTASEPAGTKYIVSQVLYDNSTLTSSNGAIYPSYVDSASLTLKTVPEPSTYALLSAGIFLMVGFAWRSKKQKTCASLAGGSC